MPRKDAVWLNLQVSEEEKTRLTDYAHWCGKSRVDVLREFIQTLPVVEHMQLSSADTQVFLAALENPPEPNEKLKQLMQTKAPWEGKSLRESDIEKFRQQNSSTLITKSKIRPWLQSLVAEDEQQEVVAMEVQLLSARVDRLEAMIEEMKEDRAFEEY